MFDPPLRIALGVQFFDSFALLFNPREIFQVVPLAAHVRRSVLDPISLRAVKDRFHVSNGASVVNLSINIRHLVHHRMIAVNRVSADSDDHIALAELIMLRRLDRAERVADAGNPEDGPKLARLCFRDAVAPYERLLPGLTSE